MKPTPLAEAAGVSASTLTRVLKEDSTQTFSAAHHKQAPQVQRHTDAVRRRALSAVGLAWARRGRGAVRRRERRSDRFRRDLWMQLSQRFGKTVAKTYGARAACTKAAIHCTLEYIFAMLMDHIQRVKELRSTQSI